MLSLLLGPNLPPIKNLFLKFTLASVSTVCDMFWLKRERKKCRFNIMILIEWIVCKDYKLIMIFLVN